MAICAWLVQPLYAFIARQGARPMTPALAQAAQRRLINLPWYQLLCNFLLWVPGGLYFPFMICVFGGPEDASGIFGQFLASFIVSAVVTSFQTFVLLERFLLGYFYPLVFTDVRPAEVKGAISLPFQVRFWFLWAAVSVGPIIVLVLIIFNFIDDTDNALLPLIVGVIVFGIGTGAIIFWVVAKDMGSWLQSHIAATREIAKENFAVRIGELRPDEWGHLTDSFNNMARSLTVGRQVHERLAKWWGRRYATKS